MKSPKNRHVAGFPAHQAFFDLFKEDPVDACEAARGIQVNQLDFPLLLRALNDDNRNRAAKVLLWKFGREDLDFQTLMDTLSSSTLSAKDGVAKLLLKFFPEEIMSYVGEKEPGWVTVLYLSFSRNLGLARAARKILDTFHPRGKHFDRLIGAMWSNDRPRNTTVFGILNRIRTEELDPVVLRRLYMDTSQNINVRHVAEYLLCKIPQGSMSEEASRVVRLFNKAKS